MTTMFTAPPDEALLARWCEGAVEAGNELIKRYLRPLQLYFRSKLAAEQDVQDLAQATWVACVELQRRDGGRLEGVASFRAYLFGIARNKLLRFYDRKGRNPAHEGLDELGSVPLADLSPGPSTLVKVQERVDLLLSAMDGLSIDQQTVLQLKYWHGLTQYEVADALGVPVGTVARRLHEAKHKVIERYAGLDASEGKPRRELSDEELRELLIEMAKRLL